MASGIPEIFRRPPLLHDEEVTQTSKAQNETSGECLPLLEAATDASKNPFNFNKYGVPQLNHEDHVDFCHENLAQFPSQFVGLDASRPWLVYWGLLSLWLLGEDITSLRERYRSLDSTTCLPLQAALFRVIFPDVHRVSKTFYPLQNPTGGFGGGYGHASHLAATYAALLSIALVGGDQNYGIIDRKAMWQWLGRLKQPDGGFQICEGGEEDTRGAYCALVITSLLDLPSDLPPDSPARQSGLRTLSDGLGSYLSRCQTYEGGISSSPGSEAHGAYAFCALGCLSLLGPPKATFTSYLDLGSLVSWLSSRQYAPEGGLAGRTNKLVDGCYSHWIGGCWPLVQAALNGALAVVEEAASSKVGNLYSSEGLARYILCCCQAPHGGLRDKPSKRPDSYHTCYTLAGVSTTEHFHYYRVDAASNQFESAFSWTALKKPAVPVLSDDPFEAGTNLRSLNPVYVIPHDSVLSIRQWSESQPFEQ